MVGMICGCCNAPPPPDPSFIPCPPPQPLEVYDFDFSFDTYPLPLRPKANYQPAWHVTNDGKLKAWHRPTRDGMFGSLPSEHVYFVDVLTQRYTPLTTAPIRKIEISVDYDLEDWRQWIASFGTYWRGEYRFSLIFHGGRPAGLELTNPLVFVQITVDKAAAGPPALPQPRGSFGSFAAGNYWQGNLRMSCEQVSPGNNTWRWTGFINNQQFPNERLRTRALDNQGKEITPTPLNDVARPLGGGVHALGSHFPPTAPTLTSCGNQIFLLLAANHPFQSGFPLELRHVLFDNFKMVFTPQ